MGPRELKNVIWIASTTIPESGDVTHCVPGASDAAPGTFQIETAAVGLTLSDQTRMG
jgi:hypothetical protein